VRAGQPGAGRSAGWGRVGASGCAYRRRLH
jgi:hypothetical protein